MTEYKLFIVRRKLVNLKLPELIEYRGKTRRDYMNTFIPIESQFHIIEFKTKQNNPFFCTFQLHKLILMRFITI